MSNPLKIGGNVLHSITIHKLVLSASWETLIFQQSQHLGMLAPWNSATVKTEQGSEVSFQMLG